MSEHVRSVGPRNRRADVRHDVRLEGELRLADASTRECTVYDLALHGVAVAVSEPGGARPAGRLPVPGSRVSLRLPIAGSDRAARISGDVRWAAGDAAGHRFGLHFVRCNRAAFEQLLDAGADLGPRLGARAGIAADATLVETFPALGGSYLRWLFERGQEILLEEAENAEEHSECALLAHAAIELWSARGRLSNAVLEHVQRHLRERPRLAVRRPPSLPLWVMDAGVDGACRRHFATPSHVVPAMRALRRGVRESLASPRLPQTRRSRPNEIVLGSDDMAKEEDAGPGPRRPRAAAG